MACDFCGADGIKMLRYRAPHKYIDTWQGRSIQGNPISLDMDFDSEWDACYICAAYIDSGDWDSLMERADQSFYQAQPQIAREMFYHPELLRQTHEAVRKMFASLKTMGLRRTA